MSQDEQNTVESQGVNNGCRGTLVVEGNDVRGVRYVGCYNRWGSKAVIVDPRYSLGNVGIDNPHTVGLALRPSTDDTLADRKSFASVGRPF